MFIVKNQFGFLIVFILFCNSLYSQMVNHEVKLEDTNLISFNLRVDSNWPKVAFGSNISRDISLVGIGEVTHGGYEPIVFKTKLVKYLISSRGFNLLLFEYPDLEIFGRLRSYINSSIGSPKSVESCDGIVREMKFLPYFYQDILIELIDWIHRYNLNHKKKVQIYGFDFLYKKNFYNYFINKYLYRIDSSFANELTNNWLKSTPDDLIKINFLSRYFKENKKLFRLKNFNIFDISFELKCELNRLQFMKLKEEDDASYLHTHPEVHFRDSILAEDIKLLSYKNKAIIWAHNNHVVNKKGLTGGFLQTWLNEKYYSIVTDYTLFANVNIGNLESEDNGRREYFIKKIKSFKNSTVFNLYNSFGITNAIVFKNYFKGKPIFLNEIDLFGRHYLLQTNDNGVNALAIFDTISTR